MNKLPSLSALVIMLSCGATAHAEQNYCESPWFANGKQLQVSVPTQGIDLTLTLANVQKTNALQCSAQLQVQGQAPVSQLGIVVSAQGNLQLNVQENQSSLSGTINSPGPGGMWLQNNINIHLNGYFLKPANRVLAGNMTPERRIKADSKGDLFLAQGMPKVGSASVDDLQVHVKPAQVGNLQTTPTSHGALQCQPVNYQAQVTAGSMRNSIDKRTKQLANPKWVDLTDWYCPEPGLSLKTVVNEGKQNYTVDIKVLN